MTVPRPLLDLSDLKRKTVQSGAISFASQTIVSTIQILSIIILARLLVPDDFGAITMVLSITALAQIFRDLGLSAATIQRKELSHVQSSGLFWLNVLIGGALTLIVALLAPLIAWFYAIPVLTGLTQLLSLTFVIGSLGAQPLALLQREMRFGRKAAADVSGAICNLLIAVVFAILGYGPWAIAFGLLAGTSTTSLCAIIFARFRPMWKIDWASLQGLLTFGIHVTGFEIVNYVHRNFDNILIGRIWGAEILGFYSRAYQLLMFPINTLRNPIQIVAFPAMSKLRDNPATFRAYYRRISGVLAFISMPLAVFSGLNANLIIELVLGRQWLASAPIFAALAITSFIQPVASLRGLVLLSTEQTKRYWQWGVINAVVVSLSFVIGVQWGAVGIALAYAIANYSLLYPSMYWIFENTPLHVSDFFLAIYRACFASLLAGLSVSFLAVRISLWPIIWQIFSLGLLFSIIYLLIFLLIRGGRAEIQQYILLIRQLRARSG